MNDPDRQRNASLESWEAAAPGWVRRQAAMREFAAPVSAWMIDALAPQRGEELLELAAGVADTGLLAAELVAPAGKVLITDQARAMVAAARERAQELGIENVEFKEMAGEWIDLPTAAVDGVLCRWGYMLMVDPQTALRETRRVLRPGGRLVLAVWDSLAVNPWSGAAAQVLVAEGLAQPPSAQAWRPGPFALGDRARLAGLLADAGFVDAVIEDVALERRHASFEEFWESQVDLSAGLHDPVMSVPQERRRQIADAVRAALAPYTGSDGSLAIPARTLVARADA